MHQELCGGCADVECLEVCWVRLEVAGVLEAPGRDIRMFSKYKCLDFSQQLERKWIQLFFTYSPILSESFVLVMLCYQERTMAL
jgi:hypothetical protein